jgi:hypothetical protein
VVTILEIHQLPEAEPWTPVKNSCSREWVYCDFIQCQKRDQFSASFTHTDTHTHALKQTQNNPSTLIKRIQVSQKAELCKHPPFSILFKAPTLFSQDKNILGHWALQGLESVLSLGHWNVRSRSQDLRQHSNKHLDAG